MSRCTPYEGSWAHREKTRKAAVTALRAVGGFVVDDPACGGKYEKASAETFVFTSKSDEICLSSDTTSGIIVTSSDGCYCVRTWKKFCQNRPNQLRCFRDPRAMSRYILSLFVSPLRQVVEMPDAV